MISWSGADPTPQLPFRRLFRVLNRPVTDGARIVTAFTDGQVTLRSNRSKIGYHEAATLDGYQGVEAGDFVVHGLDIMRGSVGVADSSGAMSSVCTVCEPGPRVDGRYAAYAIRLQAASGFPKALARGVRDGGADFRRWDTLAELPVPVPPLEEQRQIAAYLDRETGQIDELIAKQEQLLTTLAERRRAVILRAVNPPSQDGWLQSPLKRFVRSHDRRRIPLSTEERSTRKGNYPYYGASGIIDYVDDYLFNEPMVLVSEDGANLLTRNSPIAFEALGEYWVNNHAHILEPFDDRTAFWAQRIESEDFRTGVTGSAQPKLTAEALMNWPVSAPALIEERIAVERHIRDSTAPIDTLSTKATQMIALLRERRQALISAAVTGKIDVRSA